MIWSLPDRLGKVLAGRRARGGAGRDQAPAMAEDGGGVLKVGIVAFLSGPAAGPFGVPARNAAELMIENINAGTLPAPYNSKGVGGLTIQPVYIDEAGGTTTQVTELRNLVQRENVDAVIGYISSGDCLAVAPVAEELKVLTVLFDCGTPRIFEESSYKYVFRTAPHATMDSVGAARYIDPQARHHQDLRRHQPELRLGPGFLARLRARDEDAGAGCDHRQGTVPEAVRGRVRLRDLGAPGQQRRRAAFEPLGRRPRELHLPEPGARPAAAHADGADLGRDRDVPARRQDARRRDRSAPAARTACSPRTPS